MNNATKSAHAKIDACWQTLILLAAGVGMSILPDMAQAAGTVGGSNAIEQVFCNVVSMLTGTTGKAVATVAIIAVGVGALLGKISWGMALIVAVGVALVFGAATIVEALGGYSGACEAAAVIGTS